tara:strand:+ start:1368 stop:1550 length:183 start_codon:yes stop_codon:yes gene_type:complete
MMAVYYLVTVTKGDMSTKVYWKEPTYKRMMKSVETLYKHGKVDAIELEMISKKEYEDNYI